jgi:hypothetical protein
MRRGVSASWAAVIAMLVLGGCGSAPERIAVPRFAAAAAEPRVTVVPASSSRGLDCTGLLPAADLSALLGLPIDGVAAVSVRGAPAPGVGRVERYTCRYSAVDRAWPVRGEVLVLNVARFTDPEAAAAQSARNAAAVGRTRPVDLGDATAVTAVVPGHTALLTAYRDHTVDLTLLDGVAVDRSPTDVALDLARRVLAAVDGDP